MAHEGGSARRRKAQGHELPVPRRVRLANGRESNALGQQTHGLAVEGLFIRHGEHDSERPFFQVPGARFAGGMNELRSKDTKGQIRTDDDVVGDRVGLAPSANAYP